MSRRRRIQSIRLLLDISLYKLHIDVRFYQISDYLISHLPETAQSAT
jgi:hypothetical protein